MGDIAIATAHGAAVKSIHHGKRFLHRPVKKIKETFLPVHFLAGSPPDAAFYIGVIVIVRLHEWTDMGGYQRAFVQKPLQHLKCGTLKAASIVKESHTGAGIVDSLGQNLRGFLHLIKFLQQKGVESAHLIPQFW